MYEWLGRIVANVILIQAMPTLSRVNDSNKSLVLIPSCNSDLSQEKSRVGLGEVRDLSYPDMTLPDLTNPKLN